MKRERQHHSIVDACTLYDCINYYGYTTAELLGDYPIWDESRREWLNAQIENYFLYRQIGSETPEMFGSFASITMLRIMPRVNSIASFALTGSSEWDKTLMANQNTERAGEDARESTGEGTAGHTSSVTRTPELETATTGTTESKATALVSDTPQVQLSGTENYMSALNESGSSGTTTSTVEQSGQETTATTASDTSENTSTSSGTSSETVEAHSDQSAGQLSELASKWAETMPDLLGLIFDALEVCFVQVF